MKSMIPALLVLAAACGGPAQAPPEQVDDVNFEVLMAQQMAFDVTTLKLGDFVFYSVTVKGQRPQYVKWTVVQEEPDGLWIEHKLPPNPRSWIIKSKFSREGKLLEQWRGEAGTMGPVKVFPRGNRPASEPPARRDSSSADASNRTSPDNVTVGGQTYACTKVETTLQYRDGRKSTMTNWCSKKVPFSLVLDGKSYGGLVRRRFGLLTMDLVNAGNSTPRAELQIQR